MLENICKNPDYHKELFGTLCEYQELLKDFTRLYSTINMVAVKFPEAEVFINNLNLEA